MNATFPLYLPRFLRSKPLSTTSFSSSPPRIDHSQRATRSQYTEETRYSSPSALSFFVDPTPNVKLISRERHNKLSSTHEYAFSRISLWNKVERRKFRNAMFTFPVTKHLLSFFLPETKANETKFEKKSRCKNERKFNNLTLERFKILSIFAKIYSFFRDLLFKLFQLSIDERFLSVF